MGFIDCILRAAKSKFKIRRSPVPKSDFWDKLKTRLVEVSNAAADFTEEQAVVGKLKFDILNLNRKIDRQKLEIGARVLEISRLAKPFNPLDDGEVRKGIAIIGEIEAQIVYKRSEIERSVTEIRSRRNQPAKPAPVAAPDPKPVKAPASRKPAKKPNTTKKTDTVKKSESNKPKPSSKESD